MGINKSRLSDMNEQELRILLWRDFPSYAASIDPTDAPTSTANMQWFSENVEDTIKSIKSATQTPPTTE